MRVLRVHGSQLVLKPILTSAGQIEVAGLDEGAIIAVLHVDRYLFEFIPRGSSVHERVFTSFGDVLEWALSKTVLKPAHALYEQNVLLTCRFQLAGKNSNIDDTWFSAAIGDNAAVTMRTTETTVRFSAKAGVLFQLDVFGQASFRYRLDCKCVKSFKAAIEARKFVHPPRLDEDYYLQMYG